MTVHQVLLQVFEGLPLCLPPAKSASVEEEQEKRENSLADC